ncbi:hypothetical protein LTR85_011350 [Meristemomyces frigidus]|nr:hypothetical protein LTR85_011350 [Meristemomyces frigidus]
MSTSKSTEKSAAENSTSTSTTTTNTTSNQTSGTDQMQVDVPPSTAAHTQGGVPATNTHSPAAGQQHTHAPGEKIESPGTRLRKYNIADESEGEGEQGGGQS